ncbi:MAG TPA: DUF2087 domain-containing protein [Ktedonobacteraceae bacterium]|nr:DUF2087 domain-containing protein [Ktedonobacteraceae bacterium]
MEKTYVQHDPRARTAFPAIPADIRRYVDLAGRVVIWPARRSMKLHILAYLAALFEPEQIYSEKEVNELLARYLACEDYATVRRDLCDFHYLERERDDSRYWRGEEVPTRSL